VYVKGPLLRLAGHNPPAGFFFALDLLHLRCTPLRFASMKQVE
jgi:hypothetical protein